MYINPHKRVQTTTTTRHRHTMLCATSTLQSGCKLCWPIYRFALIVQTRARSERDCVAASRVR